MPIDYSGNGATAILRQTPVSWLFAFEGVLRELGLVDRSDPAARLVADLIITFVKAGEGDPERLHDLTLEVFRMEQRGSLRAAIPSRRLRLLTVAF